MTQKNTTTSHSNTTARKLCYWLEWNLNDEIQPNICAFPSGQLLVALINREIDHFGKRTSVVMIHRYDVLRKRRRRKVYGHSLNRITTQNGYAFSLEVAKKRAVAMLIKDGYEFIDEKTVKRLENLK